MYPLQPDQREFFCIVKKVNDARNHESAAAHLLRDAGYVAQWAARSQQAARSGRRHRRQHTGLHVRGGWPTRVRTTTVRTTRRRLRRRRRARAVVERGELRARSELWPPREQPPDVIEDVD